MRIYMDNCCYYRPFDDQTQDRIRLEADAILAILTRCDASEWILCGSEVLAFEMSQTQDESKCKNAMELYNAATEILFVGAQTKQRVAELQKYGIKLMDAFHVAIAESENVNVYLTTDKDLIKKAQNSEIGVRVYNPVKWLVEGTENEQSGG